MKKLIAICAAALAAVTLAAQTVAIVLALVTVVASGGFYLYVVEKSAQLGGMQWVVLEVRHGHTWSAVLTNRVPVSQNPSFPAFFIITDTNRNTPSLCRVRLANPEEIPGNGLVPMPPPSSTFQPILYDDRQQR